MKSKTKITKLNTLIIQLKAASDRKLADKDDLMQLRNPIAKNINRILFEQEIPNQIDNFLEGMSMTIFSMNNIIGLIVCHTLKLI